MAQKSHNVNKCKKTNKVKYVTATQAIAALAEWTKRDSDVCWDINRIRVYKCDSCKHFHLGKYHG